MFYYLVGIAAVIFTLLMVVSFFAGDFPFIRYDNEILQRICRLFFVICNILLFVAAVCYPEGLLPYFQVDDSFIVVIFNLLAVVSNLIIMAVFEFLYWIANIIAITLICYIFEKCLNLIGWVFYNDSGHFFDYYD